MAKNLQLILSRQLASNVATPMFVVDTRGTLVYYNEPAETLLGQKYHLAGELTAEQWGSMFKQESLDGQPIPPADLPLMVALTQFKAAHMEMVITGVDGVRREIAVTALPLMATATELAGAVAIFWEEPGSPA